MLCFLATVEMNPRTLWACQPVAFMISVRVAPLARAIIPKIFAPLLSARGALAFLAAGLAAFFAVLAPFFGAALVLPSLAAFWPLGAPFLWVAPFLGDAFSGAPCSATLAAVVVSAFVMLVSVPFLRPVGA